MHEDNLLHVIETNRWNYRQTEEAKALKVRRSAERVRGKEKRRDKKTAQRKDHLAEAFEDPIEDPDATTLESLLAIYKK